MNQTANLATKITISDDKIVYKTFNTFTTINLVDVALIQCEGNYCEFYMINSSQKHLIRITISSLMNKLKANKNLIKVHRSFIVNVYAIDKIESNYLKIKNLEIPLSKKHKKSLIDFLEIV